MITFADRKGGFPHSEIFGSQGARASPKLIAACHVLHRLSMPRHPSEALMRLIVLSKTHAWGQKVPVRGTNPGQGAHTCSFVLSLQTMMSSQVGPGTPGYGADKPFNSRCHRSSAGRAGAGNCCFRDRVDASM